MPVPGKACSGTSTSGGRQHRGAQAAGPAALVEPLPPAEIRSLRECEHVSQPVFAHYLNVRKDAVSKWERGEKKPDGPSLKLLNLVRDWKLLRECVR
jgi:DNA-binding transcriptional regulator YiaG